MRADPVADEPRKAAGAAAATETLAVFFALAALLEVVAGICPQATLNRIKNE